MLWFLQSLFGFSFEWCSDSVEYFNTGELVWNEYAWKNSGWQFEWTYGLKFLISFITDCNRLLLLFLVTLFTSLKQKQVQMNYLFYLTFIGNLMNKFNLDVPHSNGGFSYVYFDFSKVLLSKERETLIIDLWTGKNLCSIQSYGESLQFYKGKLIRSGIVEMLYSFSHIK